MSTLEPSRASGRLAERESEAPDLDSFAEQIEELGRLIRDNERRYDRLIAKSRLKKETADRKQALLYRLHKRLRWLEAQMDWIVPEAKRRRAAAAAKAELDELLATPEVQAVQTEFPNTAVTDVKPLSGAGADQPQLAAGSPQGSRQRPTKDHPDHAPF